MALPPMAELTAELYNRLPQAWRDADDAQPPAGLGGDHPLARYLSLLFDRADVLRALLERFDYVDASSGGGTAPVDTYALEVESDAPTHFWRLNEPAGATAFADDVGTEPLAPAGPAGELVAGAAALYTTDPDAGAVRLTGGWLTGPTDAALGTLASFSAVASLDTTTAARLAVLATKGGHLGTGWAVTVDLTPGPGAASNVTVWIAGVARVTYAWVRDQAAHIFTATYDGATARLFLDGAQVAQAAGAWAPAEAATAFTVGSDTPGGALTWPGWVSEVSYDAARALSAGRAAARHTALVTASGPTSDLVDPRTAPAAYLPWLAQLVGVSLPSSTPTATRRHAVLNPSAGWQAGVKSAIAAAAQTVLTGSRYVSVQDHYGGDQWTLAVITRADETPGGAASVTNAVLAANAKPAGCALVSVFYSPSWATVEAAYPTWGAIPAGETWQQVEDTGAP